MKKIFLLTLFLGFFMQLQASFLDDQKKFNRVRAALSQKGQIVEKILLQNSLKKERLNLLIISYKNEATLELWAKDIDEKEYKIVKKYNVCAKSGSLGPKIKQGDRQVPEGFYHIDRFNPASNFYLSLGINYPNMADEYRGGIRKMGGDIFIHGDCVTIGCLPMTDDKIKEIYLFAIYAKDSGQKNIPVYIFPFRMSDENMQRYSRKYVKKDDLIAFWKSLKIGYDRFQKDKSELLFGNDKEGNYIFK